MEKNRVVKVRLSKEMDDHLEFLRKELGLTSKAETLRFSMCMLRMYCGGKLTREEVYSELIKLFE